MTTVRRLASNCLLVEEMNIPWAKPEEDYRVELVDVRDAKSRQEDEQNEVPEDKVGGEETQLGNLAKELTARLGHGVPAHGIPLTRPPCNVRLVRLELTSESKRDDQLEDESLERHDGDHAQESLSEDPTFQEEHHLEEGEQHEDGNTVSNGGQDGAKLLAAHAKKRTHAAGHAKENTSYTSIDRNWSEGNSCDTDEGICLGNRLPLVLRCEDSYLRIDEQVRNQSDSDQDKRTEDLSHEDVGESGTRGISRQLGRRITKCFSLVTCDART